MVFPFVKSTGDGACHCCSSCTGDYDVVCYSASSGKWIRRQYHGHGAPGINFGERRDPQYRPNRISLTSTAVIVAGTVSLTIAPLDKCGEAITVNRGSGDFWYHYTAPSGYNGDPYSPTWFNAPGSPNNYNGKWNWSGEDYRHNFYVSKYPINGGDTAWIGWGWVLKNFGTQGQVLQIASLRLTSSTSYEWIANITLPSNAASSLVREIGYGGENAERDIGYTQNTPYSSQEQQDADVDEVYPDFSKIVPNNGLVIGTLGLSLAYARTNDYGSQNPPAWNIAGSGGGTHSSLDQIPWKGYTSTWSHNASGFAAFGLMNQRGTIAISSGPLTANAASALPGTSPLVCYFSPSLFWSEYSEIGASSLSPGRTRGTGVLWYRLTLGWDRTTVNCSMLFRGLYAAYAWKPIYNNDGTEAQNSETPVQMDGPSDYDSGFIYCFTGTMEESFSFSETPLRRLNARVDFTSQNRIFWEHARVAVGGNIKLIVCDVGKCRNLHRSNSTIPALQAPKITNQFDNPFGFCGGRPKVPQSIYVYSGYLYALVCDDDNMWDFRWLQKYRIGVLGLELIWQVEPEFEWQAFHSFCVRSGEVWATVTASDQQVFSNPTTWIGLNFDDPEPFP